MIQNETVSWKEVTWYMPWFEANRPIHIFSSPASLKTRSARSPLRILSPRTAKRVVCWQELRHQDSTDRTKLYCAILSSFCRWKQCNPQSLGTGRRPRFWWFISTCNVIQYKTLALILLSYQMKPLSCKTVNWEWITLRASSQTSCIWKAANASGISLKKIGPPTAEASVVTQPTILGLADNLSHSFCFQKGTAQMSCVLRKF